MTQEFESWWNRHPALHGLSNKEAAKQAWLAVRAPTLKVGWESVSDQMDDVVGVLNEVPIYVSIDESDPKLLKQRIDFLEAELARINYEN